MGTFSLKFFCLFFVLTEKGVIDNIFRMRRFAFLSLSILIAIPLLAGCAGKPADEADAASDPAAVSPVVIKVAYWGGPEEIDIITTAIRNWQKSHPNIKVVLEHTPFSGYVGKILTRIAGASAPDVVCSEVNIFVAFVAKDIFLDLTPFIKGDAAFNLDEFFPEVVDRFSRKGKVYAIPRDTAPFACIYYNKKLFDEAGVPYPTDEWDWSAFLDAAQRLTKFDANGKATQYGFYGWAWQNFVYSNGGSLVDNVKNPTECRLTSTPSKEGLQFYADLINKYRVAPTPTALGNLGMGAQQLFMTGRVAMFSSGIWETPILRKINGFDWDVVMFPRGPRQVRGFGTGGSGYGILKSTKYPNEAWEVVKTLSGDEGQIMLAEAGLAQPANKKIAEGEHWALSDKKPLNKKMLNEAVKYVTYEPFHTKWREISELYLGPELDLVFNGRATVDEALGAVIPKINQLLREKN